MKPAQTPPFSEADLDRLEELLDSEAFMGESLQLDELQGLLCAVISGPDPIPPSVWLPAALGSNPNYESEAQAREVTDLLMRFHNYMAEALAEGEGWELILYPYDDDLEALDYAAWADAYIFGSQLGSDWYEAVGEHAEELSDMLQPLFLLNGMLKEDAEAHNETWLTPSQEKRAIKYAQEDLPKLVSAIYGFWRVKLAQSKTPVRKSSHVGRNELCPCGSGKKYKQCCGSPEKLH